MIKEIKIINIQILVLIRVELIEFDLYISFVSYDVLKKFFTFNNFI